MQPLISYIQQSENIIGSLLILAFFVSGYIFGRIVEFIVHIVRVYIISKDKEADENEGSMVEFPSEFDKYVKEREK